MSVTAPAGFTASGVACGIKASGEPDLALVASEGDAVPAAGVFTANRAAAAPVLVSRAHLSASRGMAAAVVLSSGNANAATGASGVAHARRMCALVGEGLGVTTSAVLVCQTGLIGVPLPIAHVARGIPALVEARASGPDAGGRAAAAIMTTDTQRKEIVVDSRGFTVGGMAKGAAMLAPDMATMLAVITTDAVCQPPVLADALRLAVRESFNRLTIDASTSTNDTVLVLASGRSGTAPSLAVLGESLSEACAGLAVMMAGDAEGATKVVQVVVSGAASDAEAHRAARKVAESLLVKCSLNGEDPYWGRVVSELGTAGVAFDLDRVSVAYGGVSVCRQGVAARHDESAVRAHMGGRTVEITCELGLGQGSATVLTTDLGHGYIDENRTTS
jgi:glutamate N-acetyltransferase/amino-acid N-acetyltransferase